MVMVGTYLGVIAEQFAIINQYEISSACSRRRFSNKYRCTLIAYMEINISQHNSA